MATSVSWQLTPTDTGAGVGTVNAVYTLVSTTTETVESSASVSVRSSKSTLDKAFTGYGLLRPFQRDKKLDFASGSGSALLTSAIGQILATRASNEHSQGELPWRPEFGSLLYQLRHSKNDATTRELARVYVIDALTRWEPRIKVNDVTVTTGDTTQGIQNALVLRVDYNLVANNDAGNDVVALDVTNLIGSE